MKIHGYSKTKIYRTWIAMKKRCDDVNHKNYADYGGRGITVCKEWRDPKIFCEWAYSNGYNENLQIDRIDNDGNYEPKNCQFITGKENSAVGKQRKYKTNVSGYVGVHWSKKDKVWVAQLNYNDRQNYIGSFKTLELAVKARINKEIEIYGVQKTNFCFEQKGSEHNE